MGLLRGYCRSRWTATQDPRTLSNMSTRTVHNQDALAWLQESPELTGCSIVTSLPDASEFQTMSLDEWKAWFSRAASLVLSRCPENGVVIFYQTDLKREGAWIDKGYLCQRAAEELGHTLLWHKMVCRKPPGIISFGRPSYAHMLCFSRGVKADVARSTADVLPQPGEVTWTRGMGIEACLAACRFILDNTSTRTVVDPFCGHGTVLAVANELGLDAIGVELGQKRARKARTLQCPGFKLV